MQFTFKNIAAISRGITPVSTLFVKSNPKEIAVLYFHTAEALMLKTKVEFKRIRNQVSKQIHAISDNLKTWSVMQSYQLFNKALYLPLLNGDVSNLS